MAITGVGLLSPIGHSAAVCMHSVRSAVSGLSVLPYPDRTKEWIAGGKVLRWSPHTGARHWQEMLTVALTQAWRQASAASAGGRFGPAALILGKPEPMRPGKTPLGLDAIPPQWQRLENFPEITHLEHVAAGACNAHAALYAAVRLFEKSAVRMCLIGVADSQLDIRTTRWHEENYRLKCSYVSDGLMPGEAACFLVVEPEDYAYQRGANVIARVVSFAADREPSNVLSDQPNTAQALSGVVRTTLQDAGISATDIGMVWSDLNGESYRAREWAFTEVRLGFQTDTQLIHPADCHGDLGAATDANLLTLAALCHGTGWSDNKPQLVVAGSEGGFRAAAVVAPPSNGMGSFLQVSKAVPRILSADFELPAPPDDDYANSDDPPRAYFEWRLREDHRDDLAALHYQRIALLKAADLPWSRLADVEQRMLDHLDAVVAAGPRSMAAVANGLTSDEEGLCFAGAFLVGVLPSAANLAWISEELERPTAPRIAGIEAALLHAPPSDPLNRCIEQATRHSHPMVQAMALRLAANRRTDIGARVIELLHSPDADVAAAAAYATGRLGLKDGASSIATLLRHESQHVRRQALMSLVIFAPERTAAFCRSEMAANPDFGGALATCLAVAGGLYDVGNLLERLQAAPDDTFAIGALGILGAASCVPHLLGILSGADEGAKIAAGEALVLISGVAAKERVAAPVDPEDLPSLETREIERVNTSAEFWARWWHAQGGLLSADSRWRLGQHHHLGLCIEELADINAPRGLRARAAIEISVHARACVSYEPDWFVARQQLAIGSLRQWWEQRGGA